VNLQSSLLLLLLLTGLSCSFRRQDVNGARNSPENYARSSTLPQPEHILRDELLREIAMSVLSHAIAKDKTAEQDWYSFMGETNGVVYVLRERGRPNDRKSPERLVYTETNTLDESDLYLIRGLRREVRP
jgi:hypothetical protein